MLFKKKNIFPLLTGPCRAASIDTQKIDAYPSTFFPKKLALVNEMLKTAVLKKHAG